MKEIREIFESNSKDIAIIYQDEEYSYADLKEYSDEFCEILKSLDVKRGDKVIIDLPKSAEFIFAIGGIIKSGATYIPLDFEQPYKRLQFILQECMPQVIFTRYEHLKQIMLLYPKGKIASIKSDLIIFSTMLSDYDRVRYLDTTYIIYTSGSTGQPKGVMIAEKSIVSFINEIMPILNLSKNTRYLNVSPLYFDACILDIFGTLCAGGRLYLLDHLIFPKQLIYAFEKYQITDTLLVSSVLRLLVSRYSTLKYNGLPYLKHIWYGAESCPVHVIKKIKQFLPNVEFVHGYGPTETTHTATYFKFKEIDNKYKDFMPIGKPLKGINIRIVDESGNDVKKGTTGELLLGGEQLMQGYVDERLNEAIILEKGKRFYKTGDFVYKNSDNDLVYVGRKDDVIKRAGKLVALKEVEQSLLSIKDIKDVVVCAKQDDIFGSKIYAFVLETKLTESMIKKKLGELLPIYMIPEKIIILHTDFPRTPNGKTDKNKLLNMV